MHSNPIAVNWNYQKSQTTWNWSWKKLKLYFYINKLIKKNVILLQEFATTLKNVVKLILLWYPHCLLSYFVWMFYSRTANCIYMYLGFSITTFNDRFAYVNIWISRRFIWLISDMYLCYLCFLSSDFKKKTFFIKYFSLHFPQLHIVTIKLKFQFQCMIFVTIIINADLETE